MAAAADHDFQLETAPPPGTCATDTDTTTANGKHEYEEAWKEPPVISEHDDEEEPLFDADAAREFYPEWSWDRVRPWATMRSKDGFTEEHLENLAANDVVYLGGDGLASATRIKEINPKIKILFYWNSMINYKFSNDTFDAEAWALRHPETDELVKFRDRHYWYDHSNAEFREWWISTVLTKLEEHPNLDGVFIDAICKTRFFGYRDENNWLVHNSDGEEDYIQTAKELRSRLPLEKLLIGNALRSKAPNGNAHHLTYLDGSYLENWHDDPETTIRSIELISTALTAGRIIMLNSGPTVGLRRRRRLEEDTKLETSSVDEKYDYMQEHIAFPLGVFLLVTAPHAYMMYGVGIDVGSKGGAAVDSRKMGEFAKRIGEPRGAYERDGMVFTRRFEHVRVRVNVGSSNANVFWFGEDDDEGEEEKEESGEEEDKDEGEQEEEDDAGDHDEL